MTNAVDRAYRFIKNAILDGTYSRGTHLKEEELAELVGVSRTPIREALRRLDASGLVNFAPNHGAFVLSLTEDELDEMFELRAVLESYGAARAARNFGAASLDKLTELAEEMERAFEEDTPEARDTVAILNDRFHKIINEEAGSRRLEALLSVHTEMSLALRAFHHVSRAAMQRSLIHHRELIAALAARDPGWAASVMRCHLLAARSIFLTDGSTSVMPVSGTGTWRRRAANES